MSRAGRRYAMKRARTAKRSGDWGAWTEHMRCDWPATCAPVRGLRRVFENSVCIVLWRELETSWGTVINLMVRPHSERAGRSWADLQRIKTELVGEDATAVEVYPADSDTIDQANMYHLWVLPPGVSLPFGLHMETRHG